MTDTNASLKACPNTDRELWREREGDYYADSIHVTEDGRIGINCGGTVIVKPLREWHQLATRTPPESSEPSVSDGEGINPRPNYTEFQQALLMAAGFYNDVELAFWLNAPQPLLGMWTPVQLLARGEAKELLRVMQQLEDGVYV